MRPSPPTPPMMLRVAPPLAVTAALAATLLGATACGSTSRPGADASHALRDGMILDASAADAGPDAQSRHRCSDGQDNDGDGLVDFPEDPGCTSAEDEDESNPPFCGLDAQGRMIPLRVLPPTGHLVQTTEHGASHYAGSCGGDGAPELIFQLEVSAGTSGLVISTVSDDTPSITQLDTVLYVRKDTCDASTSELACAAADPGAGGTEIALENPAPGTYFIFVDGRTTGIEGQFLLQVRGLIPLGNPCDPADQTLVCAPGILCASPQPGDPTVCMVPYCNDGLDNDGDGIVDFPQEPGCESAMDNSEEDTCPGPGCPECADGSDNDGDGLVDWPADPGCRGAGDPLELDECVTGLTFTLLPASGHDSQTLTAATPSLTQGSCSSSSGPELVYPLHLPYGAGSLEVSANTLSYTSLALYLRQADCADGTELACSMTYQLPEHLSAQDLPPGDYFLFVDTEDLYMSDTVDVSVSVLLPVGAPCDTGNALAGCAPGGLCQDVGGGTYQCTPTACNNGVDDDGDGLVDYPNDPGCADRADTDEADSCDPVTNPSACPACSNGVDDDGDGLVDYPSDPGCAAASDSLELDECVAGLEISTIPSTGVATGAIDPSAPSQTEGTCGPSPSGPEAVYVLDLPYGAERVAVSMSSQNWTYVSLYARATSCATGIELACSNPNDATAALTLRSLPPGQYFVFADTEVPFSADSYTLAFNVDLPVGAPCQPTDPLARCGAGATCQDVGGGAYQCVGTACNNGVDDDGDGLVDFPDDPGCADRNDIDEADSCATTPSACPACFDGVDSDGDGLVDFPDDPGCSSAADNDEADQCVVGLPFADITAAGQATGAAPSSTSLLHGDCGGGYYGEAVYLVRLPSPAASVSIQTTTAVDSWGDPDVQTILYARLGQCDAQAAELGCEVAPVSGSGQNTLQLLGVDAGNLFVVVDAEDVWNSAGTYDLTVTATLTGGGTCIPTAQALQCPAGTTCADPGTGPICQ